MLKIYDGWTRYSAASDDMNLLLCVYNTKFETDVIHHFIVLNSAIPVPSLYMKDHMESNDILIKKACDEFCKKWKPFLSSSRRPQKPNFNRDLFMEQLSVLEVTGADINSLLECLDSANETAKLKIPNSPEKCRHGLYLFADKAHPWQEYFLQALKRSKEKSGLFSRFSSMLTG